MGLSKRSLRLIGLGALIIIGVFLVTCERQPTNGPPKTQKVVVAQFGDLLLYLPLYIAKEEGIFAKYGLDVEVVSTGGDDKTFAAVLSGSAQFGVADPTFVAIAQERGQRGRVVATLIDGMPNYGVSLSSNAPKIGKPSDLAGKTVATVPAPSTSYTLVRKMYESANLQPAIYQVAPSGLVAALQNKQADYALLIEPYVSNIVRNGGSVSFSLTDYYRHFALTGITTSQQTIDVNPELVSKFVAALSEAVSIFYEKPDVALRVARKQFPSEAAEDLEQGIGRHRQERIYPQPLATTEAAWSPAIHLRKEAGDLRNDPAPMDNYVDNRFTQKATSP